MQLKDYIGCVPFTSLRLMFYKVFETDEIYVGEFHTGPGWCTKLRA